MRKVKIHVPTKLSEIKLSQYQKFLRVTKDLEDDNLVSNYLVEIFCDLPNSIVRNMTPKHFRETQNIITEIFNYEDLPLIRRFKLDGVEYGFIPNLEEITVGEQVDCDTNIKDWDNMHKAMSVLFRPIKNTHKDKYTIEDYKGVGSLDLPLDIALGGYFFLQSLYSDLLSCIPNFILEEVQQNPQLLNLVENGVGLKTFTHSLQSQFLDIKKMLQK